jgi:ABC-type polysaccharide/polyol phosphate transport system ATPase subunit
MVGLAQAGKEPRFLGVGADSKGAAMAVIEFEDVQLAYPVRENRGFTLKELVLHGLLRRQSKQKWSTVTALRGVSFRIGHDERVGVIGHNGAGKSTLLRTVAGVYPISGGRRRVEGAICSLFDIGLGFEYAASGWENIRFRGFLQGETPKTIERKTGEIAEFAELGDFLNLPLNCYSTGMVMRLAFAIATSAEPEILLVDEVFGTGDLRFITKALARMREMMNRAKIVVMVGHQLKLLEEFCTRIIWLDHGKVRMDGAAHAVISEYRQSMLVPLAAAA